MPPAHPSSRPYGRNPRRRARSAASDRHQWTDAEPLPCVTQPGKRIVAVEPPGTRRARVVREVVRCIRPIARAANTVCGFRPSLVDGGGAFAVSRAAGKVRDTRDGVLRLRHIRPVARAGGIHGGERGLRLQTVSGGRTRSLYRASRSRERESSQWNRPERAGREWYAASVQLPGRRARFALQAVSGGRTRSLIVRRAAGEENRRSGTARSAPGASGALHPSDCPGGERGLRLQAVFDGRTRSLCRASRSRERGSSQWNRPERAGREWYVRWCAASVQLPGRRARLAASGRSQWTDAKPFREPRSRGRESSQWNRPERAGREWYAASVQLPGRRTRFAASGRHWWTEAEPLPCVARPGK